MYSRQRYESETVVANILISRIGRKARYSIIPKEKVEACVAEIQEELEVELLDFLKNISNKGIKFALSNVIEHKGKTHTILFKWAIENKFNIIYLNKNYSNSNYQIKNKDFKTTEVLITNY